MKDTNTAAKPAKPRRKDPHVKLVDTAVLETVHGAATARLALIRAAEVEATGVATTTLAMVARKALVTWSPPKDPPTGKRPMRRGAAIRPFRFHAPLSAYLEKKAAIHAAGQSVAGVVQDALERFARTGKY